MKLVRSKKDWAELVEVFTQLGSVTFNEADSRVDYRAWKMWCGEIANKLTDQVMAWNQDALERCKLPDDLRADLNILYGKLEKANPKRRLELERKHGKLLAEEKKYADKLDELWASDAEFEVPCQFAIGNVPLNVNGSYMNLIKEFLKCCQKKNK